MAVTDLSKADVIANFKETQLQGIHVGSPAEITVDAYPGRVFHGHVASLSDKEAVPGLDPWDFPDPVDPTSKPTTP